MNECLINLPDMRITFSFVMCHSLRSTLLCLLPLAFGLSASAEPAAFTYQGRLTDHGVPFTGSAEFLPTVWSADTAGTLVASNTPATVTVGVTNGLFVLPLDFGVSPFADGAERWLELEVRTSLGPFTKLAPRQRIVPTPYALTAANLSGPLNPSSLGPGTITSDKLAVGAAAENLAAGGQSGIGSGGVVLSKNDSNAALMAQGYIKIGITTLGEGSQALAEATIPARFGQSAVWTGSEMIVWGGLGGSGATYLQDSGRFDPTRNTWTIIPGNLPDTPAARQKHAAVWTGTGLIVWGGHNATTSFRDGGRFDPTQNTWTPIPDTLPNTPSARDGFTAVWTGAELIIWGGQTSGATLKDGARYAPASNTWTPIPGTLPNTPGDRRYHSAVWTGHEMIVWGGDSFAGSGYRDGGRYSPTTGSWSPVPFSSTRRTFHTAVWTGREMLVWGGVYLSSPLNTGSRYNPTSNTWGTDFVAAPNSPTARRDHTAVWTGHEMIVWGGVNSTPTYLNDGASFNPTANTWSPLPNTLAGTPAPRSGHTAVWTGSQMLIWGGYSGAGPITFTDTWAYNPPKDMVLYQRP